MIKNKKVPNEILVAFLIFFGCLISACQYREIDNMNVKEFEGRVDHEILSIDMSQSENVSVDLRMMLRSSEKEYFLIGPKAEELFYTLDKKYPPWNIKIWGKKVEPEEVFGKNISRIEVKSYQIVNKGWADGKIHIVKSCYIDQCEDKLIFKAEDGKEYTIIGNLVDELLIILKEKGEYNDVLNRNILKVKIYGELTEDYHQSAIKVEDYQY